MSYCNYILAVDDIPDNLFLFKLALEQEGYNVVTVDSGKEALEKIEQYPPDLILLDVMMPEMDGYELTQKIRQHPNLPFIPIILITAHEDSSVVKGLDVGADEFIRKPVRVDELQARVRSLLRLKQTIDQRDNFVSCLTHDLRTPLVAADRMLHLIQQENFGEIPDSLQDVITAMINNNQNLLQMLNNLLEVHCYDVGQKVLSFVTFNLTDLVQEIVTELSPLMQEKNLDIKVDFSDDEAIVKGDRLEIRRVLTNLISNAIKFTDQGFIAVRMIPKNENNCSMICLEIEDTGIGIPPENQLAIFERFRQGNHKRSGHGLGLYLCHQIIEAHEGTLEVDSEVDKGSLFTICLPTNLST